LRSFFGQGRRPSIALMSVLDQVFVGAASGLLVIAAAASMSPVWVGQFGLAYSVGAVLVVILRGGFLARLTMLPSPRQVLQSGTIGLRIIPPSALVVSLISIFAIYVLNASIGLSLATILVCLAFPVVLAYEILRYILVSCGQAAITVSIGFLWFLVTGVATVVSISLNNTDVAVVIWLFSGLLAVVILSTIFWTTRSSVLATDDDSESVSPKSIPALWHFNFVVGAQAVVALLIGFIVFTFAGAVMWAQLVVLNAVLYPLSALTQSIPLLVSGLRREEKYRVGSTITVAVIVTGMFWFLFVSWGVPNLVATLMGETWVISANYLWIATINLVAGALLGLSVTLSHYKGGDARVRSVLLFGSLARIVFITVIVMRSESILWILVSETLVNSLSAIVVLARRPRIMVKSDEIIGK